MPSLALELSTTINDLRELSADPDFGAILASVVERIAGMLRSNGGYMPAEADAIAADAVCIACRRDGIAEIAMTALRARGAAQA